MIPQALAPRRERRRRGERRARPVARGRGLRTGAHHHRGAGRPARHGRARGHDAAGRRHLPHHPGPRRGHRAMPCAPRGTAASRWCTTTSTTSSASSSSTTSSAPAARGRPRAGADGEDAGPRRHGPEPAGDLAQGAPALPPARVARRPRGAGRHAQAPPRRRRRGRRVRRGGGVADGQGPPRAVGRRPARRVRRGRRGRRSCGSTTPAG